MIEVDDYQQFMQIAKGLSAYDTARAFQFVTRGVDWVGCSKSHMAEAWRDRNTTTGFSGRVMVDATFKKLRAAMDAQRVIVAKRQARNKARQ